MRKAKEMGLEKKREASEEWSEAEDSLIKEHFEYAPKHMIESLLPNRTWQSISWRGRVIYKLRRRSKDRYSVNYNFFSEWTPESAYVFGFIAADGYVECGNRNFLQIELQYQDSCILKQIKQMMQYEGSIVYPKRGTVKLYISNRKLVEDIIALGMPANDKTFTMKYPESLPDKMLPHFLRGLLDGDGSVVKHNNKARVVFLGTEALLMAIKSKLSISNKIIHKGNKDRGVDQLSISGKKAHAILSWLYTDATMYLERKFIKFITLSKEKMIMQQNKEGQYSSSNIFISSLNPKKTVLLVRTQTQLPTAKPVELKLELCNEQDVIKAKTALEELSAMLDEALLEYKVTARTLSLVHEATKKYRTNYEIAIEAVKEGKDNILDMAF